MSLTQLNALQILNSGSVDAEDGIREMKNSPQKIFSPAGKCRRSYANAAIEHVSTTMIVLVIEMISELEIILGMPVCVDIPSPGNSEMYV